MVSALDSGASAPGSGPGRGHCVVFLGKTLNSHSASLHPGARFSKDPITYRARNHILKCKSQEKQGVF